MAQPRHSTWGKLKRIGRYVKFARRYVMLFRWQAFTALVPDLQGRLRHLKAVRALRAGSRHDKEERARFLELEEDHAAWSAAKRETRPWLAARADPMAAGRGAADGGRPGSPTHAAWQESFTAAEKSRRLLYGRSAGKREQPAAPRRRLPPLSRR